MDIKTKYIPIYFFLTLFLFVLGVHTVWSHSFVVNESPLPNSHHETSPTEVKITFNSTVEKNFSIKLIDEKQQEVPSISSNISGNQKEISIQIPILKGGKYQVEYYVISSNDGHPIQGSYYFQVATIDVISNEQNEIVKNPRTNETIQGEVPVIVEEMAPQQSAQSNSLGNNLNVSQFIIYLMKVFYYIGLVLLIGWVIWWRIIRNYSNDIKRKYLFCANLLQMLNLVSLISVILMQLNIFTSHGLSFVPDFPFDTNFGLLWFASFLFSLIGFLFLFKNQWFDIFWFIVIVLCKSLNGHSLEFEPSYLLVISDSIHLIAASIWAAGLTFIIVFWRNQRLYVKTFLPIFSEYAFASIIVLAMTGSYIAFIYMPSLKYFFTDWGLFLLLKLFFVGLVLIIGGLIRSKMKKSKAADLGKWIKVDFLLMMIIMIIVSILTYLNPLP